MMIAFFTKQAEKDLSSFDLKDRNRIRAALYKLQSDPRSCDLKKLKGQPVDTWRLRVGNIRVLLRSDKLTQVLFVVGVVQRKDAYR